MAAVDRSARPQLLREVTFVVQERSPRAIRGEKYSRMAPRPIDALGALPAGEIVISLIWFSRVEW